MTTYQRTRFDQAVRRVEDLAQEYERRETYEAGLADLDGPPDGIEDVRPGQQIELLEDGVRRGLLEVVSVWTRGEEAGRSPDGNPDHAARPCDLDWGHNGSCWYESGTEDD